MYVTLGIRCLSGIDFNLCFNDCSIGFWNCSDSVVDFVGTVLTVR
jgi:hypothetical protein